MPDSSPQPTTDRVVVRCHTHLRSLLPEQATHLSAGMDLRAAEPGALQPGERALVPTGLRLALPSGYEAQVRPRSGLAMRHGVTVLNSPGTIDADYRGEVGVLLVNLGSEPWTWERGDRVAQLVVQAVPRVQLYPVACPEQLGTTDRGDGGFGSTGLG